MAKYNGSGILLYADGVEIAAQKGFNLSANVALFDTTTKQSSGWTEHEKGTRSAEVSFEALQSTTGLSAAGLFDYIVARTSITAVVTGLTSSMIFNVDCSNMSVNAATEEAVGLSGSFKTKGRFYRIGSSENLITDLDDSHTYTNLVENGEAYTDVDQASGAANVNINALGILTGEIYRLVLFLTSAGQNPTVDFFNTAGGAAVTSQEVLLSAGFNMADFTITADCSAKLRFFTTAESHWSTSPVYLYKL